MAQFNEFELYDRIRNDLKYWATKDVPTQVRVKYIDEVYKAVKLFHSYGIVNDEQLRLCNKETCYYRCIAQNLEVKMEDFE